MTEVTFQLKLVLIDSLPSQRSLVINLGAAYTIPF